jgi:ubiquinone/menaquinone biosynthesis C-methylase UbiE
MVMNLKSHWDKSHEKHPERLEPSNYAVDKEKSFPRNSVVCDLGGGDGADSLHFLKNGHQVYLFDISDIGLEKAKSKVTEFGLKDKLTTSLVDLNSALIPSEDNFFDVLYARLSLHYFDQERTAEILKDVYRVLKQGGTAYIAVKSPEDKKEMEWLENNNQKIGDGLYSEDGLLKSRFSKDQYKNILGKVGIKNFKINDYEETFGDKKIYVKSGADKLQYLEIIINK